MDNIHHSKKNKIYLAIVSILAINTLACNSSDNQSDAQVAKALMPSGLGYELTVELPGVSKPLPVVAYANNNGDSTNKYIVSENAIAFVLKGMNDVWTIGSATDTANWQSKANGNGPNPTDVPSSPIIHDADTWTKNIQYVVNVTANRTDDQAIGAYLDDARNKNYSVVDGYGPLTEAYVTNSGIPTAIETPTLDNVLKDVTYYTQHDNGLGAGDTSKPLGAIAQLVDDFRNKAPASTSGSKYIYSTPRPWRMDDTGHIKYLTSSTLPAEQVCAESDGTKHTDWIFDSYTSSVSIVPGLMCSRRHHESSSVADNEENRRKDGGYPSGHTNAGYLAALAYAYALPQRFSEMLTRASQLGENRILAGMHSPVDVIGGRMHSLAAVTYVLKNNETVQNDAQAAYDQSQAYFAPLAAAKGMSIYDYAHQHVANETGLTSGTNVNIHVFDNNTYADHDAIKALYRARMTYGFTQNPAKAGQAPIVPEGAELLLASRLPYLTTEQRRAVLYTTELDSGYPILDESNGWGRINLVDAADGYGAFVGDVTVDMDASNGGFSAHDWWQNDISGAGLLTKQGSGTLTLTGNNTYSGGTLVKAGVLEAASEKAMGQGDVYMNGGGVKVSANGTVDIAGNYTQESGILNITMDADATQLSVAKAVNIDGGTLMLDFSHYTPASGADLTLLTGHNLAGQFSSLISSGTGGKQVTLKYTGNAVIAHIE